MITKFSSKEEMRKAVEQAWKDVSFYSSYKAKIIEGSTYDVADVLLEKIDFQAILEQLATHPDLDVDETLQFQVHDILLDSSNWNLNVDTLLANSNFLDLATMSITGPVIMGEPDPCIINGGDASNPYEGNYLKEFKASLGYLNLDWTDYATKSLNAIINNEALYVIEHWSEISDVDELINNYVAESRLLLDVLDVQRLHNDLFYSYDEMIVKRVKQVDLEPWHLSKTISVNLVQDTIDRLQKDIRVSPMTFDFFSELLGIAFNVVYVKNAYDNAKKAFKKRYLQNN